MYDIVVLGGGPAGVTAALGARELDASVALVERGRMGGTCTNDGCVPTRVLAKAARLLRESSQFEDYGLMLDQRPTVDFERLMARTQHVVYEIHEKKQLIDHLRGCGVDLYTESGDAAFVDPHTIRLEDGQTIQGKNFILCVGGHARRLPLPGVELALTHSDVWTLNRLPESMVIVGGGATGCQLASIFNAFGSDVTLLDIAPRLVPGEDPLVSETLTERFREHGIQVITGIEKIERLERRDDQNALVYRHEGQERDLLAQAIVLSVGWPGNVDTLNLGAAGVAVERSYISTNDYLQTSAPHIYAAGDITGKMMLVQSASYQARIAVENALYGQTRILEHRLVPHGGFTDPEYGSVGLTEDQARKNHDCLVAVVPYSDMDRAVIDGHPVGFCKLIVDRHTHTIIGAHVVGEQAVEIVQLIAAGMAGNVRVETLAETEWAYPTFAAIVGLAARQLMRDLGSVRITASWRALKQIRGAEWERQDEGY